jgi:hypothetical protein
MLFWSSGLYGYNQVKTNETNIRSHGIGKLGRDQSVIGPTPQLNGVVSRDRGPAARLLETIVMSGCVRMMVVPLRIFVPGHPG